MSESRIFSYVMYYAYRGYSRHVQAICADNLNRRNNDPVLRFWRAYGLAAEGNTKEALTEFTALQTAPGVDLAATAAAIEVHRQRQIVDNNSVGELDLRLDTLDRGAEGPALLLLGRYMSLAGSLELARGKIERALRGGDVGPEAYVALGWVLLRQAEEGDALMDDEDYCGEAIKLFDKCIAMSDERVMLDALLGRALCLEVKGRVPDACEALSELASLYDWFTPAQTERARMLMSLYDWEGATDQCHRVLQHEEYNVDALYLLTAGLVVRDGRYTSAVKHGEDLQRALQQREPRNARLHMRAARLLSRCALHSQPMLALATSFADRARKLAPDDSGAATLYGRCLMMQGDAARALASFDAALSRDELNPDAMAAAALCELQQRRVDDARARIELLREAPDLSPGLKARTLHLAALATWLEGLPSTQSAPLLEEACVAARQAAGGGGGALSLEAVADMDPSMVADICGLMLQHCPGDPRAPTEPVSPQLETCRRMVEGVLKAAPGLVALQAMAAHMLFLAGDMSAAVRRATESLNLAPELTLAHMVIFNAYMHENKVPAAQKALEGAMAQDFGIRTTVAWHVAQARVMLHDGQHAQAIKFLTQAEKMPGVRVRGAGSPCLPPPLPTGRAAAAPAADAGGGSGMHLPVTIQDRARIAALLAEANSGLGKAAEAQRIVQAARREFEGTPEESRIALASCRLRLDQRDVKGALKELAGVPEESPMFLRARMQMADIYLHHRRDRKAYVEVYEDLVKKYGSKQAYMMLGEAYLQIREPVPAIKALEQALKRDPRDSALAMRIGGALVATHDFETAVDYYERAINANPTFLPLKQALADLFTRLGNPEAANALLKQIREAGGTGAQRLSSQMHAVKATLMMARMKRQEGKVDEYLQHLQQADAEQLVIIEALRTSDPELVQEQRAAAADICLQVAEEHLRCGRVAAAEEALTTALKRSETHQGAVLAMARMRLGRGDVAACRSACLKVLAKDEHHVGASLLLCEAMLCDQERDAAALKYEQLLERRRDDWEVLCAALRGFRRAGRLAQAKEALQAALKARVQAAHEPGFLYCQGLYLRFTNQLSESLQAFNRCRHSPEWGPRAVCQMAEIYLDPDNSSLWGGMQAEDGAGAQRGAPDRAGLEAGIQAAKTLMQSLTLPRWRTTLRHRVLECYVLMSSGEQADVEKALSDLLDMAQNDRDNVTVLLAMASAFVFLKQKPKARNQLKRVSKIPFNPDAADDFERAWLLLANIYVGGGKFDLAQELCERCLKYNRSCSNAWDLLGQILEREGAYKDAAEHYHSAWELENRSSASAGYRLAFNYLKADRCVEAMEVCYEVMNRFPDFPGIREDVLEKAWAGVRP
ncbi:unnamed protein product [Pedinophyceae sp. YPF-701]|nr:unnamed protein product [Pedinophyceae sp. YPF-701]